MNLKERALAGALPWRGGSSRILCHPVPQELFRGRDFCGGRLQRNPHRDQQGGGVLRNRGARHGPSPDSVEGSPTARRTPMAGRPRVRESAWSVLETLGTNNAG